MTRENDSAQKQKESKEQECCELYGEFCYPCDSKGGNTKKRKK